MQSDLKVALTHNAPLHINYTHQNWTHLGHKRPSRFQDMSCDVQSLREKKKEVSMTSQTDR